MTIWYALIEDDDMHELKMAICINWRWRYALIEDDDMH